MGWKIYFFILSIISTLQVVGFVISRMAQPDAPFDVVSGIFNVGMLIAGPITMFLFAFRKRLLNARAWQAAFVFFVLANLYAIYYLVFVISPRMPNGAIPWVLVVLQAIYIPLLVATYKYAQQFKVEAARN